MPAQDLFSPSSSGPSWDPLDDPNDHFTDLEISDTEDNEVVAPKRRPPPSPAPYPRPSVTRRRKLPLEEL
ncbi:hypothetical protein KFL_014350020 [Klebsormidium nitens]|uniref:Uncharacterized protein n=1 Tax=Klebsormidium nitens TaxID=105231 RepID=A0A1Y1IQY0_KLENI|nr:hypothetical protein KFL_014350020 [Klebsormidium nitens]|eukprot:GAQ93315.1 hypothetical protein KFL_014350020 [Klebsormidium nitens]